MYAPARSLMAWPLFLTTERARARAHRRTGRPATPKPGGQPAARSRASRDDPANLIRAGVLRYVQNTYERCPWRNPDAQVRHLLEDVSRHGIGRFRTKGFYN